MFEVNFVDQLVWLRWKQASIKRYTFSAIQRVCPGYQDAELIVEFNEPKPLRLAVQTNEQRNLLIEVLKLAGKLGHEHVHMDAVNNPHNINFTPSPTAAVNVAPPSPLESVLPF